MKKSNFNPLTKTSEFRLKLYPKNYQDCLKFYRDTLLFPIINKWDRRDNKGVMFDTGIGIIELFYEGNGETISGCDISVEVKNVQKLFNKLRKNKNIIFPIRNNSWGDTSFCIADPAGFEITFFTKDQNFDKNSTK